MTDLLDVVSTARTDLQPVFDVLADRANRLCGGTGAALAIREGDVLVGVAGAGVMAPVAVHKPIGPIDDETMLGASALHRRLIHIRNWDDEPADRYPTSASRLAGRMSALTIPMIRNDDVLGVVAFSREEPGGYTDAEISLLKTFVDQAAIAVDNARLLQEIEQRNVELAESLELQTATSEVLQLISDNPGNLRAVFDGIVAQAARLCDADSASISRHEGDEGVLICLSDQANADNLGYRFPLGPPETRSSLALVDDISQRIQVVPGSRQIRSCAVAPLFVDERVYGFLTLSRYEVRPFEARHGRIAQAFAEQASIAISNAELFNDLDESLSRQQAMTDVLDAVSTTRTDLQPVFDVLAARRAATL